MIFTFVDLEFDLDAAKKVWSDLYVPEDIVRSLLEQKFFEPTPIQRLTLPAAIGERLDIIGAAETVRTKHYFPGFSQPSSHRLGKWKDLGFCHSHSHSHDHALGK